MVDHSFVVGFNCICNDILFLLVEPVIGLSIIGIIGNKQKILSQQSGIASGGFFNVRFSTVVIIE